jgi:uncharacterized damage-inducible protein DinB
MNKAPLHLATLACAAALALAPAARAHDGADHAHGKADAATGMHKEMIASLDDAGKKLIELAEAVPADKFSWAPGKGVRSMGQVVAHVIGANYVLPSFLGMKPPAEAPGRDLEQNLPDKAKLVAMLKASHDYAREAIAAVPESEFATPVELFGGMKGTKATVCMILVSHSHEHLGQAIAYARSNDVTPPWTARQAAAAKATEKSAD